MDASDYLTQFNSQMKYIVGIVETLQVNDKTSLAKMDGIVVTFNDIKMYLDVKSKASKKYVVTETETEFIIYRMIDNIDIRSIYEKIKPKPEFKGGDDTQIRLLYKIALKFGNIDLETAKIYGYEKHFSEFVKDKIVPYGFLQKNTSSVACFKNTPEGATKTLQNALSVLCENGVFYEIPKSAVTREFGISSKLYLIRNEL